MSEIHITEINTLNTETNNFNAETNNFNAETNTINVEINNLHDEINALNAEIAAAHKAHYDNAPQGWRGLVDCRDPTYCKDVSPNGNTIYHLYSTGEITYQKGAWAYRDRSEFTISYDFISKQSLTRFPFQFPNKTNNGYTYAILTEEETKMFREKMIAIYKKFTV